VGAHHGEGLENLTGSNKILAQIVYSAATVAGLFCQDIASSNLETVKLNCCEETGINEEKLEKILETLDEHVQESASMLSLQVGETVNYAQIQLQASVQLVQLSMQAEMEREKSIRREKRTKRSK